ncbi:MAG: FAD-dependent oxidoreductase, partial [Nannocystaceae bacterium]
VSMYHQIEQTSAAFAAEHGGGVFELHCYAVPDEFGGEEAIRDTLVEEFFDSFPELRGASILHEHAYVKADFTAFHTGLHQARPTTDTAHPRLMLAGDWVKLPCPAMLLEGAATSGLIAANRVSQAESLRPTQLYTVPLRGFLPPTERGRPSPSLPRASAATSTAPS